MGYIQERKKPEQEIGYWMTSRYKQVMAVYGPHQRRRSGGHWMRGLDIQ
jgi:hypothetical protein